MKTSKLTKHLSQFLLAVIGIFVISTLASWLLPVAAAGVFIGEVLVGTMVGEGGVTHQAVEVAEPGLHLADISKKVYELLPASSPIDTILRNIRDAETIKSVEKKYYSVSTKPFKDTFDSTASGAGTSSSVPAKSYTYASGDGLNTYYVKTTNPALFSIDDLIMLRNVSIPVSETVAVMSGLSSSQITTENIVFYVEDIVSDVLRLIPLNGIKGSGTNAAKYVVPDFASTAEIYILAPSKQEKALKTTPFGIIPEPETNYIQLMMAQVEQSTWEQMQAKEVDWNFTDLERQNIYALRWQMEMNHKYGVKSKTYNNVTKDYHYTAEGITRKITNLLEYGTGSGNATLSIDQWLAWMESAFVDNNGSPERWLLAGSGLIKSIQSMILSDSTKQIGAREVKTVYGIRCTVLQDFFGTLNIVHDPSLSRTGASQEGYILDMNHIHKHDFVPMQVKELDFKSSGEANANAKVIMEASCLTLTFPDAHAHIIVKA
jgi:hypothetical protein